MVGRPRSMPAWRLPWRLAAWRSVDVAAKDNYKQVNEESANGTADLLVGYVEKGAK